MPKIIKERKSLGTTILVSMTALTALTTCVVAITTFFRMREVQKTIVEYNTELGVKAADISSASMEKEVKERLMQIANSHAEIVDNNFTHYRATVESIAAEASYLYEHSEQFARIGIDEPKAINDGKLVVHISHSKNTDMSDPAIIDEAGLLGNEKGSLISAHKENPSMAKSYIATESGLMIEADMESSDKLNEDGSVAFYEPQERPWYYKTKELGETRFTNVIKEANGEKLGFMCASPIRKFGKFMGVACAGMHLDDIDELVQSTRLGDDGITCVVNNRGRLLFSSDDTGTLTITPENADLDLRESENNELASLVNSALSSESGYRVFDYDGERYYAAYARMDTVNWAFLIILPEKTVLSSTEELLLGIFSTTEETEHSTAAAFRSLTISIIVIGMLALIISGILAYHMSQTIVAPMRGLAKKVGLLEGDNLDFAWEKKTDDEIQLLAEAFQRMTLRMKQYIEDVKKITAEKERIGAELNVATQIQADMLPRIFPPFPDRTEFDLYATMDPAKEVGGDFYDFFMIDDDHIALVMADVSGKGVPAALFMVISKTLIKTRALAGGTPAQILENVNKQLCEGNEAQLFVTVWLAILEISTGKGIAANAGHEHPALRHSDGSFELIKYRHSPAVAIVDGMRFREHDFELRKGDSLFVFTDGVPEATDKDDQSFGEERLLDALNSDPGADAEHLLSNVKNALDSFVADAPQFDDITMLGFRYFGP